MTHYAPAARAPELQLRRDITAATRNPVVDGLLQVTGGLLAVLNRERQVVALNEALLRHLHIEDAENILGLRPGEVIGCVHADDLPSGCGTTRYCSSCGACVAIVTALVEDLPVERKCVVRVRRDDQVEDLCLRVQATPIEIDGRRHVLLFLEDITVPELRAELERAFFHDVSNLVMTLWALTCDLEEQVPALDRETVAQLRSVVGRLSNEVTTQRALSREQTRRFHPREETVEIPALLHELLQITSSHPAAEGRSLELPEEPAHLSVRTDRSLLLRVLMNMVINAFEGTSPGGVVRVWVEDGDRSVTFNVWNHQSMPEEVALRVFQRHFTTKGGTGRGVGTYAIRLLGEEYLGGQVDFSTGEPVGTVFRLQLPV